MTKPARSDSSALARGALLAAAVTLVASCSAFQRGPENGPPAVTYDSDPVTVRVENYAWATMHVYAVVGTQWESLGQVSSQGTDTYEIPSSLLGTSQQVRLAADPVGRVEAYFSDPIFLEPGDEVEWTLQNNLALSSVMVR